MGNEEEKIIHCKTLALYLVSQGCDLQAVKRDLKTIALPKEKQRRIYVFKNINLNEHIDGYETCKEKIRNIL